MVLATDLDGTFLGGSEEDKQKLNQLIMSRDDIQLIFVTGRSLENILPIHSNPLIPTPDYIIADVGATVVNGETLENVSDIQSEIHKNWPGEQFVCQKINQRFSVERQPVGQENRCSFFLRNQDELAEIRKVADEIGCDVIYSLGKYLDFLPKGVNKGSSLLALLNFLKVDKETLLVAGDTLNDLHMFQTGLKGVVVGQSEPELVKATLEMCNVYQAESPGAGGILEAIEHFNLFADGEDYLDCTQECDRGDADLVMSYHRLPYEEYEENGVILRRAPTSPNGIIPTILDFFSTGRKGTWQAVTVEKSRTPKDFEEYTYVDKQRFPNLNVSRVALTAKDLNLFYKTFSKEAFWPIIFSFVDRAHFDESHWQHFLEINQIFAERAAQEVAEGGTVWCHDYNQWMVPSFLRQLRPDVKIAFFHHTAFPPSDIFNVIPWCREIVGSLLQCDYIGFHIPRYVSNFVNVVRSHFPAQLLDRKSCAPRFKSYGCALGLEEMVTRIRNEGRDVCLGAHPVGVNVVRIREVLKSADIQKKISTLRHQFGDRCVILSVERLDYVKGPLEKLQAFEKFLETYPELHGKITLVNICTPPADGMNIYKSTQTAVEQAVGRINGRFSQLDWAPIQFYFRSLPFDDILAYYAVSNVCWITPLRDGLNLVAKEYVAAEPFREKPGRLVLSEFAGAAVELKGAFLTNPYHLDDLVSVLHQAIVADEDEARARMKSASDIVEYYDIREWASSFLGAVEAIGR